MAVNLRPELREALEAVKAGCDAEKYFNQHLQRYELLLSLVDRYCPAGGKVLDVGAAPGHLCMTLARAGFDTHAVVYSLEEDWEGTSASECRFTTQAAGLSLTLAQCDIQTEQLPYPDQSFDVVLFTEVLEHLWLFPADPLKEILRVLKQDGCLVLSTPNAVHLTARLRWLLGSTSFTSLETMLSLPIHMRHNREYTLDEVRRLLEYCGFRVLDAYCTDWHLWTTRKGHKHAFADRPNLLSLRQIAKLAIWPLKLTIPGLRSGIVCIAQRPANVP